ncbi:MAG: efflux RND transporter periplasmic adaptor subunit [Candidatus Sedimenticola sp. (ex Thyasira tokunagai)]
MSLLHNLSSVAILGVLLMQSACRQAPPPAQEQVRALKTITVNQLASAQTRTFSGVVQAADSTSLSFEVGGKVQAIQVNVGDRVKKGEILARLDKEPYKLDVTAANADLDKAQADYGNKKTEFERYQTLAKKGLVSKSQLDQSRTARDTTRNSVTFARAKLSLAQRDLKNTELRAPFDGFVAKKDIDVHVEVSAGRHVFDLDAEGALEVRLSVPEGVVNRLYLGATTRTVFPSAPSAVTDGRITEIGSAADTANAFPVAVSLLESPATLHPGITAEVTILLKQDADMQGYLVPSATLLPQIDKPRTSIVFVYDPASSTVHRREVKMAGVRENLVVIKEGVTDGEILAAAGLSFLSDGQKVRLLDEQ